MRILIGDYFATAYHSLRMNRMRTLLTTVGVAIGIASVTTILALAAGVTTAVEKQLEQVGGNVAIIRPGAVQPSDLARPVLPQQFNTSTLTESDVNVIKQVDERLAVAPIMTVNGTLSANGNEVNDGLVVATTPELAETTDLPIDQGQFLDAETSFSVAVIGQQLAIDLFGTENPIGRQFELRDQTLTIIGTLKRLNNPVNYNNIDFDNAVVINLERGKTFHEGRTQIQQINIRAEDPEILEEAVNKIDAVLVEDHGERDFQILTGNDVTATTNRTFQWIAAVMTAIAAISLVVGGIGIMNIMLVGVAERTREIGIRKSVGASNYMIVMQFLMESLLLSFLGGIVGVIAGVVLSFSIGLGVYYSPAFSWQLFAAALTLALGVGVLFGLYPAIRAARKDPIESLRQYR
jgi:putative ABC transport system permease protein